MSRRVRGGPKLPLPQIERKEMKTINENQTIQELRNALADLNITSQLCFADILATGSISKIHAEDYRKSKQSACDILNRE